MKSKAYYASPLSHSLDLTAAENLGAVLIRYGDIGCTGAKVSCKDSSYRSAEYPKHHLSPLPPYIQRPLRCMQLQFQLYSNYSSPASQSQPVPLTS